MGRYATLPDYIQGITWEIREGRQISLLYQAYGKELVARCIADCYVKDKVILDEWHCYDMAAMVRQLGQSPEAWARTSIRREGGPDTARRPLTPDIDLPGPYTGQIGRSDPGQPDRAAVRWSLTGSHSGYGVFGAPTGAPVHVMGFTHAEFGPFGQNGAGLRREVSLWDEVSI